MNRGHYNRVQPYLWVWRIFQTRIIEKNVTWLISSIFLQVLWCVRLLNKGVNVSELLLWSHMFQLVYCTFLSQGCTESSERQWRVGFLNYIFCFCVSTVCVLDVMTTSKCSYYWLHEFIKNKKKLQRICWKNEECQQKFTKCIFRRRISFVILLLVDIKVRSFMM
jgi:hypothetical protein